MSDVTLHLGDCAKVLADFEPNCIDLTVTSPPYDNLRNYKGYTFDFPTIARELYRVTRPGGVVVWVVCDATINGSETGTSFKQALYFMECGFNLRDTMIYEVAGTGAKGSSLSYWQTFEFMFVMSKGVINTVNRIADSRNARAGAICTKGRIAQDGREKDIKKRKVPEYSVRTNIWRYHAGKNGGDITDHPAPFPEALARDHILSWSNPGDIILDPMMGSGTTGKMAVLFERNFIGIEIAPEYLAIAERRIKAAQQQPRLAGL